jgi:hypothetical protein
VTRYQCDSMPVCVYINCLRHGVSLTFFPYFPQWFNARPQMFAIKRYTKSYNEEDSQLSRYKSKGENKRTTPTAMLRIRILWFLQNCCLLTVLAPLLKAHACPAIVSVLSTNNSILSPLERICSTLCTIISFTCAKLCCALASESGGGFVL